jgi:RNA polymerase sigma-70 factor (ECF subfamily)
MNAAPRTDPSAPDAAVFDDLWRRYSSRVMAYALRHVDPGTAQDVVSETFLVAWRRLRDVPDQPLPWLLVVARNTIANRRRSGYRQTMLHAELQRLERVAETSDSAEISAVQRTAALAALAALSAVEREALLLVAWDGLSVAQAAKVAGCSTAAFHLRLHRARRRLRVVTSDPPIVSTPPPLTHSARTSMLQTSPAPSPGEMT